MKTYCVLLTAGGPHPTDHAGDSSLAPAASTSSVPRGAGCHHPHFRGKKTDSQLFLVTLSTGHPARYGDR